MKSANDGELRSKARLARRYFLVIGGGISLVMLIAIAIETPLSYRATLARVGDVQMAELRAAGSRVQDYLNGIQQMLKESAGIPWSIRPFTDDDRRAELHRLMKLVPAVDSLASVDAEGISTLFVSRRELDRPVAARFEHVELLRQAETSGLAVGSIGLRSGVEPVVSLVVRGAPPGREFLVAELNLRNVSDIIRQLSIGSAGHAFMIDARDHVVAHRDPAATLLKPSERSQRQIAAIRERLRAGQGIATPFEIENSDGVRVLASAIVLPGLQWAIVAEEPLEAALAPVRTTVYRLLALLAAGVVMAFFLSAVLARRLSRPILALRESARKIARGELDSRIEINTGDEIEDLGKDFNRMAHQLQDYTTGLERMVDEKTAKLQEAMRARSLFLAAASHDLRQPLYAISILADTVASQDLPADAKASLAKQREAIAVLRGLFDNLLDLSRFESGEVHARIRPIHLREILMSLAAEYEVIAKAKGLAWRCEIPDAWASTDPELLRRIISNLLSNAVRYTSSGEVAMEARVVGNAIEVHICDTGIGIASEHQARVFEEFVQLENPGRDRDRGVGLGLSIVKKISDLLVANLRLESALGKGTHVRFNLPVATAPEGVTAPYAPDETSPDALMGLRVWVLDDDRLVREALAAQLAAWSVDYAFATCKAELEELRRADGDWPDALVIDDQLANGERGLEIAREASLHMAASRISIVTGNVDPRSVADLAESGFRVLRKPISSVVLSQCLLQAVATHSSPAA